MNFSYSDLLTIEDILRDVTVAVDDEEMKLLNIGFYRKQVKEALRKLNYETQFDIRYEDLDMPDNLIINFPSGAFNLRDIFIYNTPNIPDQTTTNDADCCSINQIVRVFHKTNFLTKGKNHGYSARIEPYMSDPFYSSCVSDSSVYFYNIQNGLLMLSDSCESFKKVRLVYNGDPANVDKTKIIPPFLREGIVSFVTERAFFYLKARDPKYRPLWSDSKIDLMDKWRDAIYFSKRKDKKERDDLGENLSRLNY